MRCNKFIVIFFFSLFSLLLIGVVNSITSTTGSFMYDNPSLPHLNPASNSSSITANNTYYFQGYTPTTLKDWIQGFFDSVYCRISGCAITGNLTVEGNVTFKGINTTVNNLVVNGNLSVKRPYGMYSSTQTQTITAPSTAYPVTFNWTEDSWLVNKANDDVNFSFMQTGDYLIELSAVVSTTTGSNKHVEIWLQKNGKNIIRSNTKVEIATAGQEQTLAVPFILDMNRTDIMRVMWASDSTAAQLLYTTNTTYSPEVPSIIMTITKISEITV